MAAFWVLNNQFQKFIDWQYFLDYDSDMTEMRFTKYIGIKVKQFRETLLLHMGNVNEFVTERTRHKRQYDRRMNERQMQSRERNSVNTKFAKPSILGKLVLQPLRNQSVVRQPTAYRSERPKFSKLRFPPRGDSRAKVQSPKPRNNIKHAKRIPNVNKSERWISKGYRFSPNKPFAVHEKLNNHRSYLRWKPTGRIFTTAGLSSGLALHRQMASVDNSSGLAPQRKERSPNLPPTKNDWDMIFYPLFDEYFNPPPRAVSLVSAAVAALRAVDLAGSPLANTIDQDVP
nr:hypothetical protein [Tanacetum cinerariifolium]